MHHVVNMEMARELELEIEDRRDIDNNSSSSYTQQKPIQLRTDDQPNDCQMNVGRNVLEELKAERNALDPSFLHCVRLLDKEIEVLASGSDSNVKQSEKIYVPLAEQRKYNLVGRLLGPKGMTLKRIQAETLTKMSILGRSSMKDRQKEEELRSSNEPNHQHLKDDLHILIEANPPSSFQKLAAGVAEVRKMLIPPQPGQPDYSSKFDQPGQLLPHPSMMRGPPMMSPDGGRMRMGGGSHGGRGGKPGMRARRGGRGMGGGNRIGGGRGGSSQLSNMSSSRSESVGRFSGPILRNEPTMDTWRDSAITKDYNHGSNDYDGRGGSINDNYGSSEQPYYNNFSDQGGAAELGYGGGGNPRVNDWKSPGPRISNRRDNRHHPYSTGGGAPDDYHNYY